MKLSEGIVTYMYNFDDANNYNCHHITEGQYVVMYIYMYMYVHGRNRTY